MPSQFSYSKLVDEAIDALPSVITSRPSRGATISSVPVLERSHATLLIQAIADQAGFTLAEQATLARSLGVNPLI